MVESRFISPEELFEETITQKILKKDKDGRFESCFCWHEGFLYFLNPYDYETFSAEGSLIRPIKIETTASEKDVKETMNQIIPMRESFEILLACANTYRLRQPLLLEGGTALGKTYLIEKFTELLHGKGVKPLDFYCSGQTDVSELMAKWVPATTSEEDKRKWNEFLESTEAQGSLLEIKTEVESRKDRPNEERYALAHQKLTELAKKVGLSDKTQWKFQYGVVPKAMEDDFILHVEEVGLAEPQITNALLRMRGSRGKLASNIQLWENGGKTVKSGPKFWMALSTNPPEDYLARNEVDPALARGVVFKRLGDLSKESLRQACDYFFTYKVGKPESKPEDCILEVYNHPEIGKEVSIVVSEFHNAFKESMKTGEKGRNQRIPVTLDDMARVADYIIYNQVRSKNTGRVDMATTLSNAINFYYIGRIADIDLKKKMTDLIKDLLFDATKATGKVDFEGNAISRKAMFDILIERASASESGSKVVDEATEEKRKKLLEARFNGDFERELEGIIGSENIPEEIKEMLK